MSDSTSNKANSFGVFCGDNDEATTIGLFESDELVETIASDVHTVLTEATFLNKRFRQTIWVSDAETMAEDEKEIPGLYYIHPAETFAEYLDNATKVTLNGSRAENLHVIFTEMYEEMRLDGNVPTVQQIERVLNGEPEPIIPSSIPDGTPVYFVDAENGVFGVKVKTFKSDGKGNDKSYVPVQFVEDYPVAGEDLVEIFPMPLFANMSNRYWGRLLSDTKIEIVGKNTKHIASIAKLVEAARAFHSGS